MAECTFQPRIPHKNLKHLSIKPALTTSNSTNRMDSPATSDASPTNYNQQHNNNNSNTNNNTNNNQQSIYDRLYLQKRDFKTVNSSDVSSYIIDELKYCTFAPQLATKETPPTSTQIVSVKDIAAYDKSVKRIRKVHEEKIKEKEAEEKAHDRQVCELFVDVCVNIRCRTVTAHAECSVW